MTEGAVHEQNAPWRWWHWGGRCSHCTFQRLSRRLKAKQKQPSWPHAWLKRLWISRNNGGWWSGSPMSSMVQSKWAVSVNVLNWMAVISTVSRSHCETQSRDDAHHTEKPCEWPRLRNLPSAEHARHVVLPGSWEKAKVVKAAQMTGLYFAGGLIH